VRIVLPIVRPLVPEGQLMSLRIDPDGTIKHFAGSAMDAAYTEIEACSVVTCRAPVIPEHLLMVGVIDDFGADGLPINMKAWALYGRSPIFGPMWFGSDVDGDVPFDLAQTIRQPIETWVHAGVIEFMLANQDRPNMLAERPEP
jgi:hypothetical protein